MRNKYYNIKQLAECAQIEIKISPRKYGFRKYKEEMKLKMDDELKLALLEVWDYALGETNDPNFSTHLFYEIYDLVKKRIEEWEPYEE